MPRVFDEIDQPGDVKIDDWVIQSDMIWPGGWYAQPAPCAACRTPGIALSHLHPDGSYSCESQGG